MFLQDYRESRTVVNAFPSGWLEICVVARMKTQELGKGEAAW